MPPYFSKSLRSIFFNPKLMICLLFSHRRKKRSLIYKVYVVKKEKEKKTLEVFRIFLRVFFRGFFLIIIIRACIIIICRCFSCSFTSYNFRETDTAQDACDFDHMLFALFDSRNKENKTADLC